MSLTLRTNRWATRIIIILHLVIWNTVGIILLQRGVSILRKRMLENNHIIETNSSIDSSIESTVESIKRAENEYLPLALVHRDKLSIDRNERIMIRVNPESPLRNDRAYPGLNVIRNELEVASKEQRAALFLSSNALGINNPMIGEREDESRRVGDRSARMMDRRIIDRPEDKRVTADRISRITRDREIILDDGIIPKGVLAGMNLTDSGSVSGSRETDARGDDNKDLIHSAVKNASRSTNVRESRFFVRENPAGHRTMTNSNDSSLWRSANRMKFSHNGGAATAITMVAIGAIMLLVGPIVIVLRILDERRQARKLRVLSADAREDLPPSYEQAVFSSEAPRYSTLALNDEDNSSSSSSPPPSPTFGFTSLAIIKPHSI